VIIIDLYSKFRVFSLDTNLEKYRKMISRPLIIIMKNMIGYSGFILIVIMFIHNIIL